VTIAAVATPPGYGGVGIVRISGPDSLTIARQLAPSLPESPVSHRLALVTLRSPGSGERLDRAFVAYMRSPASYTGEDVVELHCHGGPVNMGRILDAVLAAGARLAEPGEFTRRAVINQRLDLVQAEAVADLINARSVAACRLAQRHLEGRLSRDIHALRERLAQSLVLVEAGIDFSTEQHVYSLDRDRLGRNLEALRDDVKALLASYDRGRTLRQGIRCVIAGRPNAGKSTLLNLLLEEERAIVSHKPGTTRDYLDAELVLDGRLFLLVDTAGIRESKDEVELEGVRRSHALIAKADLVLLVVDSSEGWAGEDAALAKGIETPGVLLWNKIDRPPGPGQAVTPEGWSAAVPVQLNQSESAEEVRSLLIAAATRAGLMDAGESATISRARHREALERTAEHLSMASSASASGADEELLAVDLRLALDAIGAIVGILTPDEILGRIFSEFCIGK
jgi:tRNA modification GTPase